MAYLGVYGHVNVDHLLQVPQLPARELTVPVQKSTMRIGGTGGNLALAAASLGVPTALAACVGDDFPPEFRAQLAAAGIDLTDLRHVAGSTPRIWILTGADGTQGAIIDQGVEGDDVARPDLDVAWLDAEWVHLTTGYPPERLRVAREARNAGKKVAFDPAQELHYRWTSRTLEEALNRAELFLCNEHELERGLDALGYGDPAQLFDHVPHVLVTRGAKGSRLLSRTSKEVIDVPACPVRGVDRLEPTGAGDTFRAGLYAGLQAGRTWQEAMRTGAVAASLFLETRGTRFPDLPAVEARLAEWRP